MRPFTFLAVILACLASFELHAAGFRFIDIPADAAGPALTGGVWSPCAAPPQEIRLRFVTIPAVQNCPIVGDGLPLIVVSHGSGGWFGAHRDTAAMLADAGFVVAAVNHPGDNTTDQSRSDALSILLDRPTDIRRLTDFMLDGWPQASKIDRERIGFFGFSRGGYTGLVIAGSRFDMSSIVPLCPEGFVDGMCAEIKKGEIPTARVVDDPRFKAAVLADAEFGRAFTPLGLKDVRIPIQLWASARGGDGVLPEDGTAIDKNLPARPEYHVVADSAHFAFITPCSPEAAKALPEVCVDAGAFDRVAFHKELNLSVLAFLRKHLAGK